MKFGITRQLISLCLFLVASGCAQLDRLRGISGAEQQTAAVSDTQADVNILADASTSVEDPDIFYAKEIGLWDGRPTFGRVWAAHPDVEQPVQAVFRNLESGRSVRGALFRQDLENLGPRIRISSDAAAQLGLTAGFPVEIEIVALTPRVDREQSLQE